MGSEYILLEYNVYIKIEKLAKLKKMYDVHILSTENDISIMAKSKIACQKLTTNSELPSYYNIRNQYILMQIFVVLFLKSVISLRKYHMFYNGNSSLLVYEQYIFCTGAVASALYRLQSENFTNKIIYNFQTLQLFTHHNFSNNKQGTM